jgi:hypothetical protein
LEVEAFDGTVGVDAPAFEAGGEDAGVVEDEEVIGAEEAGEVSDVGVLHDVACGARDDHEASGLARSRGVGRDEVFGEVVVEIGGAEHGRG